MESSGTGGPPLSRGFHGATKLRADATAGVQECWLVLGPEKQIEVHRQPQNGQDAQTSAHGRGGSLTSAVVPGSSLELDRLFGA